MAISRFSGASRSWRARGVQRVEAQAKAGDACCERCRAVRVRGRWSHGAKLSVPADYCLPATSCPACKAIRHHESGHVLTIEGFPAARLRELAAIIRHAAAAEQTTHSSERLVFVRRTGDRFAVGTTSKHLGRRIATALLRACKKVLHVVRRDEGTTGLLWNERASATPRNAPRRRSR